MTDILTGVWQYLRDRGLNLTDHGHFIAGGVRDLRGKEKALLLAHWRDYIACMIREVDDPPNLFELSLYQQLRTNRQVPHHLFKPETVIDPQDPEFFDRLRDWLHVAVPGAVQT